MEQSFESLEQYQVRVKNRVKTFYKTGVMDMELDSLTMAFAEDIKKDLATALLFENFETAHLLKNELNRRKIENIID